MNGFDSSAATDPAAAAPAGVPSVPARLSFAQRFSDRLNPVFLRELQQATNAKAILGAIAAALAGIFLIGLLIALRADRAFQGGREVFVPVLMVLTPLLTMVLPMQAFNSMQHELREGAVDQLQMSELTPGRIVRGKLMAAGLLALVCVAAFAPLLAVTYLLRGIDAATIAVCLAFAVLFAVAAAAVAIALGAVTTIKPLQQLARVGVSAGLAGLTIALMGSVYQIVRDVASWRGPEFMDGCIVTGLALLCGVVLMLMIASAVLKHPYENRSTPFRVFPFVVCVIAYGTIFWLAPSSDFSLILWVWGFVCGMGALPFFAAAVTEPRSLSPRVRTLVPRNRGLALLAAPFLPGSDRGLWFVLLLLGVLVGVPHLWAWAVGYVPGGYFQEVWVIWPLIAAYVWIWVFVLRTFRGSGTGARARVRAFALTIFLFALACAGPFIWDLAHHGEVLGWSWHHLMNPFYTLERPRQLPLKAARDALAVIAVGCLLLRLRGMLAGVREVLEASRARTR